MTPARVEVADMMLRTGKRGQEVLDAVKPLSEVKLSRAAYYAFQKRWDNGEIETVDDGEES
jgi:hypothetical protein